ncbi:MAG: hypothetical protein HC849_11615 [Oscillatoriales cyanobacterium RU_3_3]|nr:hypothetical protein [Microcoleus sp. SU_5_6]NJL67533.1 hypothetical protein [Microcoleus sp. SM1_3_4]NJM60698.1 hypothetical protein [Oscillatoriales cyanobacterium RU_3_3]NJR24008.1 hypothetical protein [Richelia sp. CSU_2_1]
MKIRSFLTIATITAIAGTNLTSVTAEMPQNRGQLLANSQLSQTQIDRLKSLETKVAVPTYVPAGFQVAGLQIQPCPSGVRRFCPNYVIIYRNSNNSCFAIESTGGGIGDMPSDNLEKSYPVNNSILGKSAVLKYRKNPQRSGPTLTGNWSGQGPFYRFTGAGSRFFLNNVSTELSNCSDISPQEAVRVWESLRYLP